VTKFYGITNKISSIYTVLLAELFSDMWKVKHTGLVSGPDFVSSNGFSGSGNQLIRKV